MKNISICFFVSFLILSCSTKETGKDLDAAKVIESVKSMSKLGTTEYTLTKIIAGEDNQWYSIDSRRVVIKCKAYVVAGIDASQIQFTEINAKEKSIKLTIPAVELITFDMPPEEIIHALYPSKYKHFSENKQLKDERHPLITKGLIQSKPAKFLDGIEVRVTESFRAKLKRMGIVIETKEEKESTNFNYKNIVETPLFFSNELHTQISKLEEILEEENYQKVKKRMQEKACKLV